ncbi:tRNA (adenosine(37)-N6)-threonylcarbamoyltransferase complex dimerization subunit type 1 TsaB [Salibacterium salarium]|uniref:tRNA (Adenosine(37)-N6)-threonylcarbamoyltransferase complex dimerization subunit type 1 TsaB n=1 Tax=Salibacterium salarium TaxID=284579 RepID=A0A428MX57_9BACI|nr:tRNA (adenosine(37)-N6)-threonylcarbamoyltransferase complex dimerization subunit type 1 TsaB [Salibacterium salarium]RSL30666.1 tRNA (adenosine(37)-N6)-threonylcarbamoyltransferase complex dimerization subunit type 1 TsaB [Salibacterium salarium]
MKILAIDTSTHVMGIALAEDDKLLAEYTTNFKKNHSLRLMPAIQQMLKELDVQPKELDAIAVAKGPGSYTGVRIGVTTAKSMAWSLGIPVYGISSLQMLARNGIRFQGLICPFMDARRGQVYTGLYKVQGTHLETEEKDRIILLEDWLSLIKEKAEPVLFLSQEWNKHKDMVYKLVGNQAAAGGVYENQPRPEALAALAFQQGEAEPAHSIIPEYAQMAEAEKKWYASKEGRGYE